MNNLMLMAVAAAPQGAAEGAQKAGSAMGLGGFLPIILVFVLFYVLFIVPQRKQQKQHAALLKSIKKGDKILTTGGMYGTISDFNEAENTVFVKFADNVRIELQRSSIAGLRTAAKLPEKK